MAKRSPSTLWCILRSNELLRRLLLSKVREKHLTIRTLSEKTGVDRRCISSYLNGRSEITQFDLAKLANVLGYSVGLDITAKEDEIQ